MRRFRHHCGDIRQKIEEKDWFICQAGGLLCLMILFAGVLAGSISQIAPVAAYVKVALMIAYVKKAAWLAFLAGVATLILDRIVTSLQKKEILERLDF